MGDVGKALQLLPLGLVDLRRIRELGRKYAGRPMDLADAALIRIAEREGIRKNIHRGPERLRCLQDSWPDPSLHHSLIRSSRHGPKSLANAPVRDEPSRGHNDQRHGFHGIPRPESDDPARFQAAIC